MADDTRPDRFAGKSEISARGEAFVARSPGRRAATPDTESASEHVEYLFAEFQAVRGLLRMARLRGAG